MKKSIELQFKDACSSLSTSKVIVSQLAELLNESSIVCITDRNGIILSVNSRFCNLSGFSNDEIVGKSFKAINSFQHPPQFFEDLWATIKSGNKWKGVITNRTKSGEFFYIQTTIMPFQHEGTKDSSFIAVSHDITNQIQKENELKNSMERANQAAKAKSEFLANMSHEIRTPMNAVIGMTGLLLDTHLTERQREFSTTIRTASEQLLSLINDILDFSKIDSGELTPERGDLNLRNAIESSLDIVSMVADENGVELLSLVDSDIPSHIIGDETRIKQILVNLLNNAVKFSKKGDEVILRTSIGHEDGADGRSLIFEVSDTGIGIDPSDRHKLFKVFSQIDAASTRRYGGAGLGLAICKQLVELMGGSITVTSSLGKGSTFSFNIPWIRSNVTPSEEELNHFRTVLRGKKVLIVDDSPTNCRVLSLQLGTWGGQSTAFQNPQEAIVWLLQGNKPDIIITDYQMPNLDGVEFSRLVKGNLALNSIPIIMLTSLGNPTPDGSSLVSVMLHKPIKSTHLKNSLEKVLIERITHPEIKGETPIPKMSEKTPAHLLVAEDNPINQKVIRLILERLGYLPEIVSNGQEVLSMLRRSNYDVIIMDAQMPVMDGTETAKRIRAIYPLAKDRPVIIVLTAHAIVGDKEAFLEAGMDLYLSKPVNIDQLVRTLTCALEMKKERNVSSPSRT